MARKFLAFFAGAAAAILLVTLIEQLGHRVYPIPDGMDYYDRAQMSEYVATAPLGALLFPIAAWFISCFAGGAIASRIAGEWPYLLSGGVALLVLAGAVMTFTSIPHPSWYPSVSVAAIALAGWLAGRLMALRRR